MLSIIICSRSSSLSSDLSQNIELTIGVEHEVILIDNSQNQFSIFSAYNEGVKRSKYPYLCFLHDDVLFKTQNWGQNIYKHLQDKQTGIIGIAGGGLLTKVPSSWSEHIRGCHFIQADKSENTKFLKEVRAKDIVENKSVVVVLDGVILCARKDLFEKISFDEQEFKGFHVYDIDICLQAIDKGFTNYVVYDVLLEHYSQGKKSKVWVESVFQLFNKWDKFLPYSIDKISPAKINKKQRKSIVRLLKIMVRLGISGTEITSLLLALWKEVFPKQTALHFHLMLIKMKFINWLGVL